MIHYAQLMVESYTFLPISSKYSVQPPPHPHPPPPSYSYPPITIILTIVLLVCFLVGFFSIYFCRCFMQNILYTWHLRHTPTGTPAGGPNAAANQGGLDQSIVQSFPTFSYSAVKDYRKEKYGLECAICLVEFHAADVLRLLTPCCHVFHQECIDLWLETHKSCPVCRRNLDSPIQSPLKSPAISVIGLESNRVEDSFGITIKDENEDNRKDSQRVSISIGEHETYVLMDVTKFPRSHSTGHSIVRSRVEEDRFTLRLPEDVKRCIIRGHSSSKSCTVFGEFKEKSRRRNLKS